MFERVAKHDGPEMRGCRDHSLQGRAVLSVGVAATLTLIVSMTGAPDAWASYSPAHGVYRGKATTALYGIDGYIRPSTSAALTGEEARVNYLNLCSPQMGSRPICNDWVQIGTFQGHPRTGPNNYSSVHIFIENEWFDVPLVSDCIYTFHDKGSLASANQAYYVTSTGGTTPGCNGLTQHEYAFRKISFTSSPIDYGYMASSSGVAEVGTELHIQTRPVPQGTEYYGTDDTHAASGGYGIHVQTSSGGAWNLWSSSQVQSLVQDNPPYVTVLSAPWAFSTGP